MAIIHYLTIQICKRVFFNPNYGVMRSYEPIAMDESNPLQPVCLFGVSVDNLNMEYTQYCKKEDVFYSASSFLKTFWERGYSHHSGTNWIHLKGLPDLLIIDHRAKDCFQASFFDWLQANNIEYQFSESTNRTAIAKFLQHQQLQHLFGEQETFQENSYSAPKEPLKEKGLVIILYQACFSSDFLFIQWASSYDPM